MRESEIIKNADGSIYHLNLLPEHLCDHIITVGDPDRVKMVSDKFDTIDHRIAKREFHTHIGTYKGVRIMVISTGIGTDNIDIVFNELDILANFDMETRTKKETHRRLNFYRIGTSGALQSDIETDTIILSSYAIGLEGLMHFYNYPYDNIEQDIMTIANTQLQKSLPTIHAYAVKGSTILLDKFSSLGTNGVTLTASGFYAPQCRHASARPKSPNLIDELAEIRLPILRITNMEMETAGIYGMANILEHNALSINCILANRVKKTFSKHPNQIVDQTIDRFLEMLVR